MFLRLARAGGRGKKYKTKKLCGDLADNWCGKRRSSAVVMLAPIITKNVSSLGRAFLTKFIKFGKTGLFGLLFRTI
jgi:hypothetical protein